MKRFLWAAAALLLASAAFGQLSKYKDWAKTPEADFLTPGERQAWSKVASDADAEKFIADYWAKRGGEPFRQEVARRIAAADQQFKLRGQKGSESARGRVFLTLGNPSRVMESRAGGADAQSGPDGSGSSSGLAALQDQNSAAAVMQTWVYDKSKFDASWDVGEVRAQINVDPQRGRDELVNAALVNKAIDKINEARLAEVQKKMAAAGAPAAGAATGAGAAGAAAAGAAASSASSAAPPPPPAPAAAAGLPAATRAVLEPMLKGAPKPVSGFWGGEFLTVNGDPFYAFQLVKFSTETEPAPAAMKLGGVVTKEDGTEVTSFWEDAQPADMKGINGMDKAVDHSISVPAGTYRGAFGLFSADGATALTSASTTFTIGEKSSDFKISPMILAATLTPLSKRPNPTDAFVFGMEKPIRVEPRGNHDFSREDGLWYFYTVANPVVPATADAATAAGQGAPAATTPAAPAAATTPSAAPPPPPPAKPRIMTRIGVLRDGKPAFQPATLPAELQPLGTNFYGSGSEIPLASFEPGYYTFTLNVRDLNAPRESAAFKGIDRSGDFVVLGPDGKMPPTPTPIPPKATPTPRPKKKA